MAFNHRKMLVSHLPRKDFNLTVFIPCFQIYSPPPSPPQSYLSLTTIYVVGFVLLFFFLVVMLYLYITDLRRSSAATVAPGDTNRGEDENDAEETGFSSDHNVWRLTRFTTVGLHRSAIDSITVFGFKKGDGIIDGTECSVCLNEFEEDESLRLLPKCSHAFHINCIDTWLLSHKNCPLCRAPVLLPAPPHHETETNHQSNNDLGGYEEESSGSRNTYILPRTQSDLVNHCGSGCLETVRRSFSIGGPSSLKAGDRDDLATRSGRRFSTSFSATFSYHQDQGTKTRFFQTE